MGDDQAISNSGGNLETASHPARSHMNTSDTRLAVEMGELLHELGEKDRIKEWLRAALDMSGWANTTRARCCEACGPETSVRELAALVRPKAQEAIPVHIRDRLVREISDFIRLQQAKKR